MAMVSLIGGVSMLGDVHAQELPTAAAKPGSELTVYLLTMGSGDQVWEKFGHNAIWIHDAVSKTDIAYHWGLFDFADKDFMPNFLRGNMRYSMGAFDVNETIEAYRQANRTVWVQELNLTPVQRRRLSDFVAWNILPENRYYSYDYFRDNCSTRIRDALNSAVGGAIRSASEKSPSGTSYRFHTERLTQDDPFVYTGTLVGLGQPVDRLVSRWEEMFLPVRLMHQLRSVTVANASGATAPLVLNERVLFQAARPAEPTTVNRGIGGFLVASMLALLAGLALWARQRNAFRSSAPMLMLAASWSLIAGVLGVVLAGLWIATSHVYSYRNENLLQATPLSLILAALLINLAWRLRSQRSPAESRAHLRTAATLAGIVAALSAAGFVMQVLPPFDQANGGIIALALPLHLGVAGALFDLSRRAGLGSFPQRRPSPAT